MFTAIVLSHASQNACIARALGLGVLKPGEPAKCHHVTLAMGDASHRFAIGEERHLTVTHVGVKANRVCAFKVRGAEDSKNGANAHVTIAVFNGAKPKESNDITDWQEIASFPISGKIAVCE